MTEHSDRLRSALAGRYAIERDRIPELLTDTFLARLRGEPRFQELLVRVKREWEELEV
ncbi:MAG: hypothetical protein PVJ64_16980 [Gemmatimonadales bacterium]|jgi:hypothetical protein